MSPNRLLFSAFIGWIVIAIIILLCNSPLGHDESAYAIIAHGVDRWPYRSPGTIALARLGALFGTAEWPLRLGVFLANSLVVVAVYTLGRVAYNSRTGAWAAAVIAGTGPMVMRSVEILGDLAAMTCTFFALAIIVSELTRKQGARWRLVTAAPALATAFYIRYGSAPLIAIALALTQIVWWERVRRRPWPMAAMIGCLGLALLPHLLSSHSITGSWTGILELSSGTPRRTYVGEGLVSYLTSNPFTFYGVLATPIMLVGLWGFISNRIRSSRPTWFLTSLAIGQMIVLGLHNHAQPRYVFVATALLVIVGVDYVSVRFAQLRYGAALAIASVSLAWGSVAVMVVPWAAKTAAARRPVVDAAAALRASSPSKRCIAFAKIVTQLQWYSGCEVRLPSDASIPLEDSLDAYVVSLKKHPVDLASILAMQQSDSEPLSVANDEVRIWRLLPKH